MIESSIRIIPPKKAVKVLEEAIKEYDFVIANSVDNSENYFYKGIAYYRLSRFDEAVLANTMALQQNPNMGGAYSNRSAAFNNLGEFSNALSDALKAKNMGQNVTEAYLEEIRNKVK